MLVGSVGFLILLQLQLFLSLSVLGNTAPSFVTLRQTRSRENPPACCAGGLLISCELANIDVTVLGSGSISLPEEVVLNFQDPVEPNGFYYSSSQGDATIVCSSGNCHGHAMTASGRSFVLEYCGDKGHVWKEIDVANIKQGYDGIPVDSSGPSVPKKRMTPESDNTTMVRFSIKFYYTAEFARRTSNIDEIISLIIAETNQGYANSGVPLQAYALCKEQATIDEDMNPVALIGKFSTMRNSYAEIRDSADVAQLLVADFDTCGIGYKNGFSNGQTLSATTKHCALGAYTSAHEIGHNFGLHHNREEPNTINEEYPYGYGHLIDSPKGSGGFRTIMAYTAEGHISRVNYYSNPNVLYPGTNTATGTSMNNNAAVLLLNRFSVAALGNEESCGTAVSPPKLEIEDLYLDPGPDQGNVYVKMSDGLYIPICDDNWGYHEAQVTCRHLGYQQGSPTRNSYFGHSGFLVGLDDVRCSGAESSLNSCYYKALNNCARKEKEAGVICSNTRGLFPLENNTDSGNVTILLQALHGKIQDFLVQGQDIGGTTEAGEYSQETMEVHTEDLD